jgi:hypothetical protein
MGFKPILIGAEHGKPLRDKLLVSNCPNQIIFAIYSKAHSIRGGID